MRVIICCLNSKYIHASTAPWCLFAAVRAACADTVRATVSEGTVNENPDVVLQRLLMEKPDVISFCTYIWNVELVLQLAAGIKRERPETVIALGGPEVGYRPAQVLTDYPFVDYILSGEGERSYPAFLTALETQGDLHAVRGLCFRTENGLHISAPALETEDPISPYVPEYFAALNGRIAYLETSRGCPYSCAFCLSGRCGTVRFFDLETAKQNLLLLANSGAKTVKLVDRTFNADKRRAYALFSFIFENYGTRIPDDVCFHFEIAGDILDDALLSLLASAPVGAVQLEIGLQSFQSETLEYLHRKTDMARLTENIRRLLAPRNIHIHLDLIAGLPLEDAKGFQKSFDFAFALQPDMLQFGFLKLLHGAPMREEPERYPCTYQESPPYTVTETPWLSQAEILKMHRTEDAFDRIYNSGRFRRTVAYALSVSRMSPFAFFSAFADYLAEKKQKDKALDSYSAAFYAFLCTLPQTDSAVLRDKMVCDRLASNASGILPAFLKKPDSRLKEIRTFLNQETATRVQHGVKRAVAILYTEHCAVYADYTQPHRVTGAYTLYYISKKEK